MRLILSLAKAFLFTLLLISNAYAAKPIKKNSPPLDQQCNVSSGKDFSLAFTIENANLTETVWVTKKGGGAGSKIFLPLWTNDSDVHNHDPLPVIIDQLTEVNGNYDIQLFYTADPNNNKKGLIDYYLYRTDLSVDGWYYISSGEADLTDFKSAQITVGGSDLIDYNCYEDGDVPDFPAPSFPESCNVFPAQLQTWVGNAGANLFDANNSSSVKFPEPSGAIPQVGFKQESIGWNASITGCNSQGCIGNERYIVQALNLGGLDDYPIPTKAAYEDLSLWNTTATYSQREAFGKVVIGQTDMTLTTGEYWFDSLELNNQSQLIVPTGENVILHTKTLIMSGLSIIGSSSGGRLLIYVHDSEFSYPNPSRDFVDITGNAAVYADIYSEKYVALNRSVIYGSLTAVKLAMTSGATIYGELAEGCGIEPPNNYTLVMTPISGYSLICENQVLEFQVKDLAGDVNDYSGLIHVKAEAGVLSTTSSGSGTSEGTFNIENGELSLYLRKNSLGTVEVNAYLVDYPNDATAKGDFEFVPFKFAADDQNVVAGKVQSLDIRVLACSGEGASTVTSYNEKDVPYSYSLLSPISGTLGKLTLITPTNLTNQIDFEDGIASIDITYDESGIAKLKLTDSNFDCTGIVGCPIEGSGVLSGSFEIRARPWTFAICDENSSAMNGTSSSGIPYTAAGELFALRVIPIIYMDIPGTPDPESKCNTDITTNFFASDAEPATVFLRAEKQTPSSGVIGTGSAIIVKDDAGTIISSGERKVHSANSGTTESPFYLFNNLYWNEVGSLMMSADIDDISNNSSNQYLDMTIDTGTREIGRFYPHHLTIIEDSDTLWDYADEHNDFAYMGQNIGHSFIVQAESSQDDSDGNALITTNYGLFTDNNIVTVIYKATANIPNDNGSDNWENIESTRILPIDLKWTPSSWGDNTGQIEVGISDFNMVKNGSTLDGPFTSGNANFGLVSDLIDSVNFETLDFDAYITSALSGKRFSEQPDFRYGRMLLSDVGGNQGTTISIPLKVEYWDGDQFVTNSDDNGSALNSDEYCSLAIWSEIGSNSNVSLELNTTPSTNESAVSEGQYAKLIAKQGTSRREQFKIWLRQGSKKTSDSDASCSSNYVDQPWLQYFWNGPAEAEEDPSTIVTFGIYRGNDRVIFRGENRFTGQ